MKQQTDFFLDIEDQQRRQQFRMTRLQVFNWGTFSDLHDISIAPDGFLFVGRSGSGKSTLLDAIAALLVPPQWLLFNAAARDGERSRRDRTLASYVRGAWGDQKDLDSGEIATRYLRAGTTWSALALTLANEDGRQITLAQLYWLRGNANANADVRRHYLIAERAFDLSKELSEFDLDVRKLKHGLPDVDHFGDIFRSYSERFRRLLGIESEMALKLLHKTQSAKNLGDLNTFLREFMLDEPASFEAADRLVAEFAELDAAHQEVVTARRQVEVLCPAREQSVRLNDLNSRIEEQDRLLTGIDGFAEGTRSGLLAKKIDELGTREQGLLAKEQQLQENLRHLQEALDSLRAEHREQGGDRIESLEHAKTAEEERRDQRMEKRCRAKTACETLGWTLPDKPEHFSERLGEAHALLEDGERREEEDERQRDSLRDRKQSAETEYAEVLREIEAMERQPSNIPAQMLDLRRQIASALGSSESDLPFIGELIEVKEEEAAWRGAIERLLHGFALSLLVDDRLYAAVSTYVNDRFLGKRLVYYRVDRDIRLSGTTPALASLWHKLKLKETTHLPWMERELQQRFDYSCVNHLRDFRREKRALTREGQVRHGPDRHEKDDRFAVDDRRRWVLGFDNRAKLTLFKTRAQELAAAISDLDRQLTVLKGEKAARKSRYESCLSLVNLEWREIDVASSLDRIQKIEQQLRELREGNRTLQALEKRIEKQQKQFTQKERQIQELQVERRSIAKERQQLQEDRQDVLGKLEALPAPDLRLQKSLHALFLGKGPLSLKNLDERRREVERNIRHEKENLTGERSECVRKMERAFTVFKDQWPQAGADFDATLDSVPDFLGILQRLELDALPRHERRFFDMLKDQSTENLAALNKHLSEARKDIHARMELVNEGLAEAEFNPGTHLQIEVVDRHLPDVREFRDQVLQVLGHAWKSDQEDAEERFLILRGLVQKLGGAEPEQRRWREQILDVRLHVEFVGREQDAAGHEVELYRSGAGKSGGQREKLATTCLAAALRYQLGGADGGLPIYAPVVLDEAFGKADNEFTELAMRIFERFGFQMIVATPLKSVMTLEPFIGGACLVDIVDRKRSATLAIEYDRDRHRLRMRHEAAPAQAPQRTEPVHGEDLPA